MDKSSLSHTAYICTCHIVFIPKYRRKIMYGKVKRDAVEIIKKLCAMKNVEFPTRKQETKTRDENDENKRRRKQETKTRDLDHAYLA